MCSSMIMLKIILQLFILELAVTFFRERLKKLLRFFQKRTRMYITYQQNPKQRMAVDMFRQTENYVIDTTM